MTELDRTSRTVVGLCRDHRRAEEAIRDLRWRADPSYTGPERRLTAV